MHVYPSVSLLSAAVIVLAAAPIYVSAEDCYMSKTHCQCMQVTSNAKCYDFSRTTAQGAVCTERTCGQSYKCDCSSNAREFCEVVSDKRQVYTKDEALPGGLVKCSLVESSAEGASLLEGAKIPALEPLSGSAANVGIWTDTECACSLKSENPPPAGRCAELLKVVGDQSYCTTRDCKAAEAGEMTCDIIGKSVCTRQKYNEDVYLADGPTVGSIGGAPCHKQTIQKESIQCTSNCQRA